MSDFPEVKDHLVANPDKYNITNNPDGTVTLRPTWVDNPSEVLQAGTAVDAAFLQKIPEAIDAIDTKVTSQLAETGTQLSKIDDFTRYGVFQLPSDYKAIPFELYRDELGVMRHTFSKSSVVTGTEIFVDAVAGNDTRDGLTAGTSIKTLRKAIELANAGAAENYTITYLSHIISYGSTSGSLVTIEVTKNIVIRASESIGKATFTTANYNNVYTWVADGTAYKTTRSSVRGVFDKKAKDYRGHTKGLKKVSTIAECQAARGTYYTDNVEVWVNLHDGRTPQADLDLIVILDIGQNLVFNIPNKRLVFQNLEFICQWRGYDAVRVNGNDNSNFYAFDCLFAHGELNGIQVWKPGNAYMLDCTAHTNGIDGFNYHGDKIVDVVEAAFEYNCHAFDNGWSGNSSSNATTAHDGMYILRVRSVGYRCHGPVLADVNGCYSINIDCTMYDSTRSTAGDNKAAYYFDNNASVKNGKVILINCAGGGVDTYSLNSDKLIDISLKNFKGNNIPSELAYSIIA